nr:hypothetical protein [Bacteroidota bacterium]
IDYGLHPKDNFVIGINQSVTGNEAKMRVNAGMAFSITTLDISGGASSKAEIDSIYGTDLPFEPGLFRGLMIFNSTTTQPQKSSVSGYINFILTGKWQTFSIEYRYIGAAFNSFGNPFIRNDVRSASVEDRFRFFKRKISLSLRYRFEQNNLAKQLIATTTSNIGTAQLLFSPAKDLPRISARYTLQYRKANYENIKYGGSNDLLSHFYTNISHRFNTGDLEHVANLSYTDIYRRDRVSQFNNSNIKMLGLALSEYFDPFSLGARYNLMIMDAYDGKRPLAHTIEMKAQYDFPNKEYIVQVMFGRSLIAQSAYSYHSARNTFMLSFEGIVNKRSHFVVEAGYDPYRSYFYNDLNYDEWYVNARFVYDLAFAWK